MLIEQSKRKEQLDLNHHQTRQPKSHQQVAIRIMVREFFGATSLLLLHFIHCEEKRKCFHILSRAYSFFLAPCPIAPIAEKDSNPEPLNEGPLSGLLATELYSPRPLDVLIFSTAAVLFVVCLHCRFYRMLPDP